MCIYIYIYVCVYVRAPVETVKQKKDMFDGLFILPTRFDFNLLFEYRNIL